MTKEQESLFKTILENVNILREEVGNLEIKLEDINNISDINEKLNFAHDELFKGIEGLRVPCDTLEKLTDRTIWTLPTYKDLLFFL